MQVIGVAEPDNGGPSADIQTEPSSKQSEDDERIGRRLLHVGRLLELGGVWGINGVRQRVLVRSSPAHCDSSVLYSLSLALPTVCEHTILRAVPL